MTLFGRTVSARVLLDRFHRDCTMKLTIDIAEIFRKHVSLTIEGLDRMYLSAIVPRLQLERNGAAFFLTQRNEIFVKPMIQMTRDFVAAVETFAQDRKIPMVSFATKKEQRKEDVAITFRDRESTHDCVLFIGTAQEKAYVPRISSTVANTSGRKIPWLKKSSAMVKHFYFYCWDSDFGPFFIKYCSYFPYNAKLCLNGHEYLKRQLTKEGIAYEPLDNGLRSCADPKRAQEIADSLDEHKIQALWDKWSAVLPQPFTAADRAAGYRYELFIQQGEFSHTQVFDDPQAGRLFFEQLIRDNLDLGRPDKLQLVFDKRIPRTTKTNYRTRLVTKHVTPSLWLDYKSSSIKQYFKEWRALRTELTINRAKDFRLGKALKNLPQWRQVAFAANKRLLSVEQLSHDPTLGESEFRDLTSPQVINGQRTRGLRFGDETVLALMTVLLMFRHIPEGLTASALRESMPKLLDLSAAEFKPGQVTYQLRRLRLRGLIERVPHRNLYEITEAGYRAALFYVLSMSRVIRPLSEELNNAGHCQRILNKIAHLFATTKT